MRVQTACSSRSTSSRTRSWAWPLSSSPTCCDLKPGLRDRPRHQRPASFRRSTSPLPAAAWRACALAFHVQGLTVCAGRTRVDDFHVRGSISGSRARPDGTRTTRSTTRPRLCSGSGRLRDIPARLAAVSDRQRHPHLHHENSCEALERRWRAGIGLKRVLSGRRRSRIGWSQVIAEHRDPARSVAGFPR